MSALPGSEWRSAATGDGATSAAPEQAGGFPATGGGGRGVGAGGGGAFREESAAERYERHSRDCRAMAAAWREFGEDFIGPRRFGSIQCDANGEAFIDLHSLPDAPGAGERRAATLRKEPAARAAGGV